MFNTRQGYHVRDIRGHEYLTHGERTIGATSQRHYQVEYPKDLNLLWKMFWSIMLGLMLLTPFLLIGVLHGFFAGVRLFNARHRNPTYVRTTSRFERGVGCQKPDVGNLTPERQLILKLIAPTSHRTL